MPNRAPLVSHLLQGYSLIEVLIGILIFSVGILGMAGMQLSAKHISYDALQRSIAITLAHDIIERMRSNPRAIHAYVLRSPGAVIAAEPQPDCLTADCTSIQLAAHDIWEWQHALLGSSETLNGSAVGGLVNPRACIAHHNGLITVAIAWKGFQSLTNSAMSDCGQGLQLYGENDSQRQLVIFKTMVLK